MDGDEARARAVPRQAVAAHAHSARPRHLRRRRQSKRPTIIVDDVNSDPRYLACSLETKSEIVVPIMRGAEVLGEIDIDSDQPAAFKAADRELLERVAAAIASGCETISQTTLGSRS